jgi:pimeloyl-ACP methyl ester carboxylesterase
VLVTPSANGLADWDDIAVGIARIRASRSGEPWYAEAAAIEAETAELPDERRRRLDRGLRPFFYGRWDSIAQAHAAATDSQMSLRATAAFRPENGDPAELVEAMKRILAPTLIVVAELDGISGTTPGGVVADHLPNAASRHVVEIAGAGHYPWLDAPVEFVSAVEGWLRD